MLRYKIGPKERDFLETLENGVLVFYLLGIDIVSIWMHTAVGISLNWSLDLTATVRPLSRSLSLPPLSLIDSLSECSQDLNFNTHLLDLYTVVTLTPPNSQHHPTSLCPPSFSLSTPVMQCFVEFRASTLVSCLLVIFFSFMGQWCWSMIYDDFSHARRKRT